MIKLFINLLVVLLFSCQSSESNTQQNQKINNEVSIEGVWKITQIINQTPENQFANPEPQDGIFIFTKEHYSMVWNPNDSRLEDYKNIWKPTDKEKINSYNSINSNSGKYEIKKNKIICKPKLAKIPSFIGGKAIYAFLLDGNYLTLQLENKTSYDGRADKEIKNYKTTLKLIKIE